MALPGQVSESWPCMAPLGHVEITKVQKLLKSKNKNENEKQNEKKNENSFLFSFCFFVFVFGLLFLVFVFNFYYGTSRPPCRCLRGAIHEIDSKNERFLLSASVRAKFGLVFVLTLQNAFC